MRHEGTEFLFWVLPKADLQRKKNMQMVESGTPSQGGGIRAGRERREGAKPFNDCAVNMTTTSEGELLDSTDLKVR